MIDTASCKQTCVPAEFRDVADALFPTQGGSLPSLETLEVFADSLGIGAEYRRLLDAARRGNTQQEEKNLLAHFQNNLDLLIQKTWVEKADEARKEKLLDKIPGFITRVEHAEFRTALVNFSHILEELAYLFFGAQSYKEDFTEYTFRIDSQMGLFWWYGGQLSRLQEGAPDEHNPILKAILFLGICYLTNF